SLKVNPIGVEGMKKVERVNWLRQRKKGFIRYCLTTGLPFSTFMVVGTAFIRNDFYLDVLSRSSFRLYVLTIVGAFFYSGLLWLANDFLYRKHKNSIRTGRRI
ncbi:hypothetical protein, partial [Vibrio vulnificus]|uniref:hypothetical protein n=1 Tax=Vibrio vulnificus TaxID=672 RepID=UPI001A8E2A36